MARLLISAAHKSSGKTMVSIGLCAALAARGLQVQPFKKGPDYIDPMWLGLASGRPCLNLDPYLMTPGQIRDLFARHAAPADISIVEGNKGLYDGLALDGSNSNAALAHMLDLPVLLVIDARGMTRGIAPLILGYQAFDRNIRIAGVILNQLGGSRHEAKLRSVIEHYTDVPVLGAIAHDPLLAVAERHLGLMPSHERQDAAECVRTIGERIAAQVDLQQVLDIANSAPALEDHPFPVRAEPVEASPNATLQTLRQAQGERLSAVRIGIARDKAFGFYYPDDLAALEAAGAELVPFDTLNDPALPEVDGLFIGGGFPEMFMSELQANASLRENIACAIETGLPVYAECGGLMYLARSLSWRGTTCRMVGAIPGDVTMHDRPVGRGYVTLATTPDAPWPGQQAQGPCELRGHEFHYSSLDNLGPDVRFAYRVTRGHGVDGRHDGIVHRNVLASYAHLRNIGVDGWARHFVDFVRSQRKVLTRLAERTAASAEPAGVTV
jgi:cobyrinic acid a,c-diamide synthase